MDFVYQYSEHIGEFLSWISNPETSIPVIKLLQGFAAVVGALISALGFYKAWRFAESRLGRRLTEFLEQEEIKLIAAREAAKAIHDGRSTVKHNKVKIFSNQELHKALRLLRRNRLKGAEAILNEVLHRTKERETIARKRAELHERQQAMAYLLLGAISDSQADHRAALAHFQSALDIDEHDVEALEYVGVQLLRLGDAKQALVEFEKLAAIARSKGDDPLHAYACRNIGLAHEALPTPSPFNANIAYRNAIEAFPQDGPPLDLAYIHELRGLANIKLGNRSMARESLMTALAKYSQLQMTGNGDVSEAKHGVERIHTALEKLEEARNSEVGIDNDATSPPDMAPVLMKEGNSQELAGAEGSDRGQLSNN